MIADLKIKANEDTPNVYFSKEKKIFEMVGRSMPENVNTLFTPIVEWFKAYFSDPLELTPITINLEYINSASSKKMVELLILFENELNKGAAIKIIWMYKKGDYTLQKKGNELLSLFTIPFELVAV